ncbi:MAG: hypothetical protein AMS22_01755 [Thiotrichales bacterium SG8_50]|nr:MAG: hypothetical protein AMS22_01755 [Thiotrichales bacterium SG8_50]
MRGGSSGLRRLGSLYEDFTHLASGFKLSLAGDSGAISAAASDSSAKVGRWRITPSQCSSTREREVMSLHCNSSFGKITARTVRYHHTSCKRDHTLTTPYPIDD